MAKIRMPIAVYCGWDEAACDANRKEWEGRGADVTTRILRRNPDLYQNSVAAEDFMFAFPEKEAKTLKTMFDKGIHIGGK